MGLGLGVASGYSLGRRHRDWQTTVRSLAGHLFAAARRQAGVIMADPEDAAVVIARDHARLSALGQEALRCPIDRLEDRRRSRALVRRLVAEASAHEVAEEWHVWPSVRSLIPSGTAFADRARDQELELKRVLHALDSRRPGDTDYLELIRRFIELSAAHIDFEEHEVWPQLQALLGRRDRVRIGRAIVKARRRAPTRPHPSDFADPEKHPRLVRSVGLVEQRLDRMRARDEQAAAGG